MVEPNTAAARLDTQQLSLHDPLPNIYELNHCNNYTYLRHPARGGIDTGELPLRTRRALSL
jgi:hypothetical protein